MRELGHGPGQHDLVVEALQGVRLCVAERRGRRDAEDGGAVGEGGGEAGEGVAEAAVCCREAGSYFAGDFGVAFCGLDGDGFVAGVD